MFFSVFFFFFFNTVASWFISPLLSGLMSGVLFVLIRFFILKKVNKFHRYNECLLQMLCSGLSFECGHFHRVESLWLAFWIGDQSFFT